MVGGKAAHQTDSHNQGVQEQGVQEQCAPQDSTIPLFLAPP